MAHTTTSLMNDVLASAPRHPPQAVPAQATAARALDLRVPLTFTVPQTSKPYLESAALTGGEPRLHFLTELRTVTVRDMRPCSQSLSLDVQGFELRHHRSAVEDFYDDAALRNRYDQELAALLGALTGADRVAVFDYTRRSDGTGGAANSDGRRGPAGRVHVDYTVDSGPKRAADALGAPELERVLGSGGRVVQVNVWRPIVGPVRRAPLALADAASVKPEALIATDQRFPDRVGEIYQLAYADEQRWYWAPFMRPDEVLLIKGWDSANDGRARFTPHGAFQLPLEDPGAPPRESIEARTFLIFEATA